MRICKITNIKPDGKPWESQYGLMYPFYVVLEDGGAGTTNSKTEQPPYKVGDSVGYDITGSTPRGVPKIKITRNPKPGEGTVWTPNDENPELESAQQAPVQRQGYGADNRQALKYEVHGAPKAVEAPRNAVPVHGATIGGALARAVDMWMHVRPAGSGQIPEQQDFEDIEKITRGLVAVQLRIEEDPNNEAGVPF